MQTGFSAILSVLIVAATSACGGVRSTRWNASSDDAGSDGVAQGTLVLFGGDDQTLTHDDTWTFDGAAWTKVETPTAPRARDGAAMAALGNRVVLFGGSRTTTAYAPIDLLDDTWVFDGKSWAEIETTSHPPARAFATMAPLDGKVVLFGGTQGGTGAAALDDTWTFDGTIWTEVPTPSSPSVYVSDMASNLTRQGERLVLVSDHTWAFDSATWTELPAGPTPANLTNGAALATLNRDLILYTVGSNEGEGSATWRLAGSTWEKIPLAADAAVSDVPEPSFLRPMVSRGDHLWLVAPEIYGAGPMDVWSFDGAHWTNLKIPSGPPLRYYLAAAYVP